MKRFIFSALLCWGVVFSLSAQASITRFAVVDMNRITEAFADQLPEIKVFKEKRDKIQAEIDKQGKELQELNVKLAEAKESGNQNQIRNLENQIRTKTQNLQTYIKNNFAELEKERERLLKNEALMNQILPIVRSVAESEGYSMVLSRTEGSGIIWYSPAVDITNKVIEKIRSGGR